MKFLRKIHPCIKSIRVSYRISGGANMSSAAQRAELQSQIWKIANDVRGSVDGWDFKQYVLGTLFYRFISENFSSYIEAGDESIKYAELPDSVITDDLCFYNHYQEYWYV